MRLVDADELLSYVDRVKNCGLGKKKSIEYITKYISNMPTAYDFDKVIGQYKWERDIAMYQLEQLGIGFGQKLEDEVIEKVKEVIRCV